MKSFVLMLGFVVLAGCATVVDDASDLKPAVTEVVEAPPGDGFSPKEGTPIWPIVECDTWKDCPDPPICTGPACVEHLCQFKRVPDGNLCAGGGMCIDGDCRQ